MALSAARSAVLSAALRHGRRAAGARRCVASRAADGEGFSGFPLSGTAVVDGEAKGRVAAEAIKVEVGPAAGAELIALGLFESAFDEDGGLKSSEVSLPAAAGAAGVTAELVASLAADCEFKGAAGSSAATRLLGGAKALQLVGMGKEAEEGKPLAGKAWGGAAAAVASAAKEHKCAAAALSLVGGAPAGSDYAEAGEAVALGTISGAYEDTRFKEKGKPTTLTTLVLDADCVADPAAFSEGAAKGRALALGRIGSKDLVNAPPNWATPACFASYAADVAALNPARMSLTVLEKEDCVARGMGAYLGVANGSDEPPKFIHLTYKPAGEVKTKLALVGKGVTFDSGGYNLKVGGMIELMKFDCGGAAAVLGCMRALADLQPGGVEVHAVVAACENMIGGDGLRPGDVLRASNGKTIEVLNTDAEGRLTLADAMVYAGEQNVDKMVDIATLTGACIVSLGEGVAGTFSDDDGMWEGLDAAAKASGEELWRLPLVAAYADQLKSPIADLKNLGGRWGGSITAGLFLKEFVPEGVEWAHVDMAGPVWNNKTNSATGFGATTLAKWVMQHAE